MNRTSTSRLLEGIALPCEGLGWFRKGLGLLCVLDSVLRLPSASFFLSDLGVLPRSQYFALFETSWAWSIYLISGRPEAAFLWLLLTIGIGLWHASGRSTKLTRVVLWILLLSVQNRHPGILDSSDDLLRLMLFWDIFLPTKTSSSHNDLVSPATVGLQFQLTLVLVLTALSMNPENLALASQWMGSHRVQDVPWFSLLEQASLLLLVLATWWSRVRVPILIATLPVLLLRAVLLHPVFPLTLLAGLACLVRYPKRDTSLLVNGFSIDEGKESHPRLLIAFFSLVSVLALGLNVVTNQSVRAPLVSLGQGLGLLQNWERLYPLASDILVDIAASRDRTNQTLWMVTAQSNRRERLFADRVGRNVAWSSRLGKAVDDHFGAGKGSVIVWMRVEGLRSDFGLDGSEVQLLSPTSVTTMTKRKVTL